MPTYRLQIGSPHTLVEQVSMKYTSSILNSINQKQPDILKNTVQAAPIIGDSIYENEQKTIANFNNLQLGKPY